MTEPLMEPMPPTTSMTMMLKVMAKENEFGVKAVIGCAQRRLKLLRRRGADGECQQARRKDMTHAAAAIRPRG